MPIPPHWNDTVRAWRKDPARSQGPIGLAGLAREAYALSQALLASPESWADPKDRISCAKGCAACCRQVIPLSPPEAFLLAETHAALDWVRRAEAEDRRERTRSALANAGMAEAPLMDSASGFFALGLACPYLVDDECGIHPLRPLACREHLATSPAAWCSGFPDASIRMLDLPASVGEALAGLAAQLMGYRELIPMPRLPEWLEANREWAGRAWEAPPLLDRLAAACHSGT